MRRNCDNYAEVALGAVDDVEFMAAFLPTKDVTNFFQRRTLGPWVWHTILTREEYCGTCTRSSVANTVQLACTEIFHPALDFFREQEHKVIEDVFVNVGANRPCRHVVCNKKAKSDQA